MKTSEAIELFAKDYSAMQAELKNPPKTKTNPYFNSSYVDLADGLQEIRTVMSKHNLSFIQGTSILDGLIVLNTRIMHNSGQWIESDYPIGGFGKPQDMGSAMTYARRYALFGLAGVAGEDDDDGNAAQNADQKPVKTAKAPAKQMDPGLKPDDSEKLLAVIKVAMDRAIDPQELAAWAAEHKEQIGQLLPSHRKDAEEYYKATKAKLSK